MFVFDPNSPSMQHSKSRKLLKGVIHTQHEFDHKLRAYLLKTGVKHNFYDNQLPCHSTNLMWDNVDSGWQCCCCGQMLVSGDGAVKLMSCSKCRITHYCDRVCQKCDWKQVHKSVCCASSEKKSIQEAMHICIRALSLMTLSGGRGYAPTQVETKVSVLDEFFRLEKRTRLLIWVGMIYPPTPWLQIQPTIMSAIISDKWKSQPTYFFPIWDTVVDKSSVCPDLTRFHKNWTWVWR